MFSPQSAIDAAFTKLGMAATLDPDGAAVSVTVMPSQQDRDVSFGSATLVGTGGVFDIRVAEFAGYGEGAVLLIGSERRVVQGEPEHIDRRRLILRLDTRAA